MEKKYNLTEADSIARMKPGDCYKAKTKKKIYTV
jgi:hypothetical protein